MFAKISQGVASNDRSYGDTVDNARESLERRGGASRGAVRHSAHVNDEGALCGEGPFRKKVVVANASSTFQCNRDGGI